MHISVHHTYRWGVFLSFVSAFLWSTTFIGSRYLLGEGKVDPLSLSFLRFLIAGSVLFVCACFICPGKLFSINVKNFLSLIFLSLTGITGMSVFLFYGLKHTTAMNGSIIIATSPLFIMLIGTMIGEKITMRKSAGLFVSLVGSMLVINLISFNGVRYDIFSHGNGNSLILLSALCWAVYSVFGKKTVKELGGYVTTTWVMVLGVLEHLILLAFIGNKTILPASGADWLIIAYIAVFPGAIAFFAYYEAIRLIELSLVNTMQYLTPACTIVLALFILNENMTYLNLLGIIVILVGILMTSGQLTFHSIYSKAFSRFG